MTTSSKDEIKEFAIRVERLCEFILAQERKNGSKDITIIQDLKEEAANIQFDKKFDFIDGLHDYMKGLDVKKEPQ